MGKQNKTIEMLSKVFQSMNDNETMLSLYKSGKDVYTLFGGKTSDVAVSFIELIRHGLDDESDGAEKELMYALLFAIRSVLEKCDDTALKFSYLMEFIISSVVSKKKEEKKKDEEEKNVDLKDLFGIEDKECLECDGYVECLISFIDKHLKNEPNKKKKGCKNKKHCKSTKSLCLHC